MHDFDGLLLGATLVTLDGDSDYGAIADGALGWRDGVIAYVGPRDALAGDPRQLAREVIETDGGIVTPGLVVAAGADGILVIRIRLAVPIDMGA